jgi:hypothetical protein
MEFEYLTRMRYKLAIGGLIVATGSLIALIAEDYHHDGGDKRVARFHEDKLINQLLIPEKKDEAALLLDVYHKQGIKIVNKDNYWNLTKQVNYFMQEVYGNTKPELRNKIELEKIVFANGNAHSLLDRLRISEPTSEAGNRRGSTIGIDVCAGHDNGRCVMNRSDYDISSNLTHEYGHTIFEQLSEEQIDDFYSKVPRLRFKQWSESEIGKRYSVHELKEEFFARAFAECVHEGDIIEVKGSDCLGFDSEGNLVGPTREMYMWMKENIFIHPPIGWYEYIE